MTLKPLKDLIQSNKYLSIIDNMIYLAAILEIEQHVLERFKTNQDTKMTLILEWNKQFLTKYGLTNSPNLTIKRQP